MLPTRSFLSVVPTTTASRGPISLFFSRKTTCVFSSLAPNKVKERLLDLRLNKLPATGCMTKVVCTIGPATDSVANINSLVHYGMNVARLNFSHSGADYSYPEQCLERIRNAPGKHQALATGSTRYEKSLPNNLRGILVDTKGPEIRTGPLQGNAEVAEIQVNDIVELTLRDVSGDPAPKPEDKHHVINVDYQSIAETLKPKRQVMLDDGLIALDVIEVRAQDHTVICTALNGGPIKKNKGVNLPGTVLDLPALTEKDKRDLKWACDVGADFVAASFIRTAANVRSVVAFLDRCIAEVPVKEGEKRPLRPLVISKIESKEGVDNFSEILHESDGIMVARGDLGVEIPYSKVFAAQKMMIQEANALGKPVITATQMLDSMQTRPRPTRAEVTDVGTAVLDGTDACMLSGETAAGKYPMEALRSMASIVYEADEIRDSNKKTGTWNPELHDRMAPSEQELDAVATSGVQAAIDMKAKAIVIITATGRVARAVARHQPTVPVLTFCTDPQVARRLQLNRGIIPIMLQSETNPKASGISLSVLRAECIRTSKELGFLQNGDRVIMVDQTKGKAHDHHEYSHNMKVVTVRSDKNEV